MSSRVALLAIAAAAAVSCTSQVIVEPEDKTVKVIMNAQLKTSELSSVIHLSLSNVSETEPLHGATVTVSVNGGAPVSATEMSDAALNKSVPYVYNGSFNPGDVVRIEAKTPYGNVSSEVTVPEKVNIDKLDTLRTTVRGSGYTEVNLQFKITVKDSPVESDFYRFTFFKEESYKRAGDNATTTIIMPLHADASSDPVLSEGIINTGDLLSQLLEMENTYMIFNDNTFNGDSRTLRVNVNMEYLIAAFSYDSETPEYDPASVHVVLEHLSFAQYHYLKAMNNLDNLGYDASFFFEPTTIPSNVEGGLGFVTIATDSDPVSIRIPDDIYLYEVRYREQHPEDNPYN